MFWIILNLGPTPTQAELENLKHDQTPYVRRWATSLLADLNWGKPLASPLWGYEGSQAMKVLGLPALRWADDVEDLVTASARRLVDHCSYSAGLRFRSTSRTRAAFS